MAITQTGAMYKGFTFDGVSSKTYGVYISGDAAFNAPERDVEMIEIPGRNGAYVLDKGRFANITVTYPAGIFGTTESDFAEGISDLRNVLASKKGYCRLEDEYNPDEYRMAVYRSGLDVTPAQLKAGEFEIVFDCMPQRFLTSGETKTAVASGGSVTNPTLFDASPLLEVTGYGTIGIGNYSIDVENVPMGETIIFNNGYMTSNAMSKSWNTDVANNGDDITVDTAIAYFYFANHATSITNVTNAVGYLSSANRATFEVSLSDSFSLGTSKTSTQSFSATVIYLNGGVSTTQNISGTFKIEYNGSDKFKYTLSVTYGSLTYRFNKIGTGVGTVDSTVSALGTPLYIDLDIGEAYKIENGVTISSDAGVSLGGDLPVLVPGSNTFTYPNTVTQFKVTPRWWKV